MPVSSLNATAGECGFAVLNAAMNSLNIACQACNKNWCVLLELEHFPSTLEFPFEP